MRKGVRSFAYSFITIPYRKDLNRLAKIYGTDKYGRHCYTPHYMMHFSKLRKKNLKILEIGVGGDENPFYGGASLRMWKRYFANSFIYGLDIVDKSYHEENRIKIFKGDQSDEKYLLEMISEIGRPDIIIDDGSHINSHIITSFNVLFPLLNDGGIYVIEDLQTSYWNDYGGDNIDINNPNTAINYFKSMVHCLNYKEFKINEYEPTFLDQHITGLHFYHNIIFINKKHKEIS